MGSDDIEFSGNSHRDAAALTALSAQQGFERIHATPNLPTGGDIIGDEWWHFQDETQLVKGKSPFGEMLGVHAEATVAASPPWKSRERVFGVNSG